MSEQATYEHIVLEQDGPIARLTLDRPDARNAMSTEMGREIRAAVDAINRDDAARVVVVRGAGKAFSGGGDLQSLEEEAAAATEGRARGPGLGGGRTFYSLFLSVRDLRVPSIAAINGHAIGAGLCFALGCDLRIIHEKAKVGMTFVKVGIHPGMAATWNLPRLIGPARAAELLYSGRLLDAAEAVSWGIASRSAGDDFDQVVDELAGQIASCAPVAVRLVKQTLRGTFDRDIDAALALEADQQAATFRTHDALEGIRAIREKRSPQFSGR
ncbi:MAG TPA: enoyl-CoA hydratase/isomerase family protein [Thermoanaerobaculia bacterium]|nr:enoyl-CoA hydratase/isomerase family protein [Thermoanaerobaculia bacterium]